MPHGKGKHMMSEKEMASMMKAKKGKKGKKGKSKGKGGFTFGNY